jgi:hypothetical protein
MTPTVVVGLTTFLVAGVAFGLNVASFLGAKRAGWAALFFAGACGSAVVFAWALCRLGALS